MVTVICLQPRAGMGLSLDKGDEWEISETKAARLIKANQVKLKDPADAERLPQVPTELPVVSHVLTSPLPSEDDEYDDSDALNGDGDADAKAAADAAAKTAAAAKPATALEKAKAKKGTPAKPKAQ